MDFACEREKEKAAFLFCVHSVPAKNSGAKIEEGAGEIRTKISFSRPGFSCEKKIGRFILSLPPPLLMQMPVLDMEK